MPPTKYIDRPIPVIFLADFENGIDNITEALCAAAEDVGFFCITEHGIPLSSVEDMFDNSARFFSLPDDTEADVAFASDRNAGWEKNAQIRPSTGVADRKESYQMQFGPNMNGKWLSNSTLPGFQSAALDFMHQTQAVSGKPMICFARGLGFDDNYFIRAHDTTSLESQTVCRLLHYFETLAESVRAGEEVHRAGAHTDWGLLTLLFQKEGPSGLEICPGREVSTSFGHGDTWTKVEPTKGAVVCNIGDLLMSWSDDRFKSTFHRVKAPAEPNDYYGERYSIAFFNQPCSNALIQGPKKKDPPVTGAEFTKNAMKLYYSQSKKERTQGSEDFTHKGMVDVEQSTKMIASLAA